MCGRWYCREAELELLNRGGLLFPVADLRRGRTKPASRAFASAAALNVSFPNPAAADEPDEVDVGAKIAGSLTIVPVLVLVTVAPLSLEEGKRYAGTPMTHIPAFLNAPTTLSRALSVLVLSPERPMLDNDAELEALISNGSGNKNPVACGDPSGEEGDCGWEEDGEEIEDDMKPKDELGEDMPESSGTDGRGG